jgi:type II secretory ATPase GspE/PulE/Tfp pilus assembly ATPase PilB-like protein
LSIAQRLVRLLCPECRQQTEVPPVVRRRFELGDCTLYRAAGCSACGETGYRGRAAIFEVLPVTESIAACIYQRKSADEIRRRVGRPSLFEAGLVKVRAGETSLEELLRVVSV